MLDRLPINFLEKFEKKEPFLFKDLFPKLVSWKDLELLINLRPFMSDKRVRILGPESYNWYASEWTTDPDTFPASLLATELKKYVFYIKECSRINQQVNDLCKEIEKALNTPIDVHLYFSLTEQPIGTKHGFGIHKDRIDVIIIQSEGISKFKLWHPQCNPTQTTPQIDEVLETGSIVYIPAGYYHEVHAQSKRISLSFAFGNKNGGMEDRHWISLP